MVQKLFLVLLLALSAISWGMTIDDVYVQQQQKLIRVENAVVNTGGSIVKTQSSMYRVDINDQSYLMDLSSESSIRAMAGIFTSRFIVYLTFLNVKPNKRIYFDNNFLSSTGSNGDAEKVFYLDKPGSYKIELKDMIDNVVDGSLVIINSSSSVKCAGEKMICNIMPVNS